MCPSTHSETHLCSKPDASADTDSPVQHSWAAEYDAGRLLPQGPLQILFYQTSFLFYASVVYEVEVKLRRWLVSIYASRELVGNFKGLLFYMKASQ